MRRVFIFSLIAALSGLPAFAEEEAEQRYMAATRALSINRSLLTRAEAEYRSLTSRETEDPGSLNTKRLSDLRYKIQALNDDAARLRRALPNNMKADEFMKEMIERQKMLGHAERSIDTHAEKEFEEKVQQIYRMHEMALVKVSEQRFEDAEKIYEEILLLSPDDDEAYLLLGHASLAAGHYEKAANAFRGALHIDPRNMREIPRLYENILVENPSDVQAMTQLGYAHLLLGGVEQAREAFQDALSIDPRNESARRGLMELGAAY